MSIGISEVPTKQSEAPRSEMNFSSAVVYASSAFMERIRYLILKRMVLRTASIWVQRPGGKARLRILFDSGCQRTLAKWSSIKSIGIRPEMGENIHIFGLAGATDGIFRHNDFCLSLLPGDGRYVPVFLYALAVDEIGVIIPSATKGD